MVQLVFSLDFISEKARTKPVPIRVPHPLYEGEERSVCLFVKDPAEVTQVRARRWRSSAARRARARAGAGAPPTRRAAARRTSCPPPPPSLAHSISRLQRRRARAARVRRACGAARRGVAREGGSRRGPRRAPPNPPLNSPCAAPPPVRYLAAPARPRGRSGTGRRRLARAHSRSRWRTPSEAASEGGVGIRGGCDGRYDAAQVVRAVQGSPAALGRLRCAAAADNARSSSASPRACVTPHAPNDRPSSWPAGRPAGSIDRSTRCSLANPPQTFSCATTASAAASEAAREGLLRSQEAARPGEGGASDAAPRPPRRLPPGSVGDRAKFVMTAG